MAKIELNIPESLNDITLDQYQKFVAIEEPTQDDLLLTFLNINTRILNSIIANEIEKLCITINNLFEHDRTFVNRFTMNGIEYGFIPDLDAMTYAEYRDLTTYINDWSKMNKAMAVLFRPIKQKLGKKYLISDYEGTREYSETMKHMPLGVVLGAHVFFYNLTNELLKAIPNYMEKMMDKEVMNGQVSVKNGEDIKKLTNSLKVTLDDMMKLQNYHSINVY